MAKLLLLSVVLAMMLFPILAARERHPVRGLKRALVSVFLFNLLFMTISIVAYIALGFSRGDIPPSLISHYR